MGHNIDRHWASGSEWWAGLGWAVSEAERQVGQSQYGYLRSVFLGCSGGGCCWDPIKVDKGGWHIECRGSTV